MYAGADQYHAGRVTRRVRTAVKFEESRKLQQKSHALIPGGCHTYAKGDDQYPVNAPGFIARGKGCHVWDLDGNEYIEYGMGLRSVTLGHAYEPVLEAAYSQMQLGNNFTRPSTLEVDCAEDVLDLIETAEMVKFAKNGSDATTAAVKLARAYTGKDKVAICADHPFFSTDDWFIGSTDMSAGIPQVVRNLTVKYRYNNMDSVNDLFDKHHNQIACLIMEAATVMEPQDGFLKKVKDVCEKNGALFILDEMITGFRWHLRGAQKYYGVCPDLSTFGKGMANGFSLAALLGKREIMELGGIYHDRERVFLLSTTHGAENHALAAARKTIEIYKQENVVDSLWKKGNRLASGVKKAVDELKLNGYFEILGMPCNLVYAARDQEKNQSQSFRTLFLQETIKRGLLMPSMVVSYSHSEIDIDRTIERVADALCVYKSALENGIDKHLQGRPVKPVFRKFN